MDRRHTVVAVIDNVLGLSVTQAILGGQRWDPRRTLLRRNLCLVLFLLPTAQTTLWSGWVFFWSLLFSG